jgi:hypothetical protein
MKYLFEGYFNPRETKRFMESISPYVNVRFNGNQYRELINMVSKGEQLPLIQWFAKFNDKITIGKHTLTEIGDILSVIFGGYARYKTNIERGMTHENALKDFEAFTVRTQQSDLKSLQASGSMGNVFTRLSKMFKSQDMQYFQKYLQNYIDYFNNDKTKTEFFKTIALYNLFLPLVMTLVSGAIGELYGKRDKKWYEWLKEYAEMVFMSFTGLGFLTTSVAVNLFNNGRHYYKESEKLRDWFFNVLGAATGKPIQNYWKLFFDRKYGRDLYDSDDEKGKKRRRIERN